VQKLIAAAVFVYICAALVPGAGRVLAARQASPVPAAPVGRASQDLSVGRAFTARQESPVPAAPVGRAFTARQDAAQHRAWLNQYCVSCHNSKTAQPPNDPVNLESVKMDDLVANAATWERVLRKLSVRAMPPQGMPRPAEAQYAAFTTWLSTSLDRAWEGKRTPGRYVAHRLNRAEYANAIRDLLALDINVAELLPADGANFGFDNIADSLTTSPLLFERYLTAAQRISTMAVGNPGAIAGTTEYSISREFTQSGHVEGLPLGTRGGTVVRHVFPADGEYKLLGRLVRGVEEGYAGVEGNDQPHTFVITLDGAEVYSALIGGHKDHEVQARDMNEAQALIDARMTGTVRVTAGPHDVGFTWRERPGERQDVWQPSLRDSQEVHMIAGLPRLKTVGIEGPYKVTGVSSTPSRERLFVCRPASASEETACAQRVFSNLARRAYRRPVTAADVEAPIALYNGARQKGGTFDAGIRAGVARILSSPSFLYRVERDRAGVPVGGAHPVSDIELASRLSFFLWSSIPDETLLNLATAGRLREPGVLAAQVRRMIEDDRADAFVENFAGQWLQLRNLESKVNPDLLMFPDFDDNIRRAFRRETELLFSHVLRESRSALELLSADYTFLNERLARHYGIPGVYGARFRQVTLADPNRRGILGHGSILSLTSVATRTSPVFRGKFILATLLDTPPPPPPPNVPTLEASTKEAAVAPKTVREQLELHRRNPGCASCHRVIDPPGFALERFNSVGQWRDSVGGVPIDSGGVLADGTAVNGPAALRNAILSRPEAFVTTLTSRMLTYALGRGLEPADMPVVRSIVRRAGQNDHRLAALVTGIVESPVFQMRTRLEPAAPVNQVAQSSQSRAQQP
jgi:mono/diheme cytochrome c family protein